jgi:NADPH2:quinone reductase
VLVNAAAGGVGIAAVQLAKGQLTNFRPSHVLNNYTALGAKVIAAAGSQSKLDICRQYGGADYTVNYTNSEWQNEVLQITGGKGVDVVYDPVGRIQGTPRRSWSPFTILTFF